MHVDGPIPESANGDYHLLAGSAPIDTARAKLLTTDRFDGQTRPAGLAPDLGAFER